MPEVPEEIIRKADRCHRNFQCISADNSDNRCEVIYSLGEIIFVYKNHDSYCDYCMQFGEKDICRCPVMIYLNAQRKPSVDGKE